MGILSRLFGREKRSYTINDILKWITEGNRSRSGVAVSSDSALSYNPWWAGVSLLADSVAMLPLAIYQDGESGREKLKEHTVYQLLNGSANGVQSSWDIVHLLTLCACHVGNGYAEIERDRAGTPIALWSLPPDKVTPRLAQVQLDGQTVTILVYDIEVNGAKRSILSEDVLHIKGLSTDGIRGKNPVETFRDSIGLGLATERYGAQFFSNGARPAGALKIAGQVNDADAAKIRSQWENVYGGLDNAHRIALLQAGADWVDISQSNENSQFLETRKFSVQDVARILRIKPHMLGDMEKSSYASIEAQGIEFVTYSLMPWLSRWKTEVQRKLLSTADKLSGIYAEHVTDALLRGDTESRYRAYATGRQWGWLSINDIRQRENLSQVDGGDSYSVPLNMTPAAAPVQASPADPAAMGDGQRELVKLSHRGLLSDLAGRIVRREVGSIRKAVDKGLPLEPVFDELRGFVRETLSPAVRSLTGSLGETRALVSLDADLGEFIENRWGGWRAKGLSREAMSTMLDQWESAEPTKLCDSILSKWGK